MTAEEVVDLVTELEDEVNNGGFHQYFNNSSGDHAVETVLALHAIGARAMANIMKRAMARFPEDGPPKDREARVDILWEVFPGTHEFDDLDNEFFAYPDVYPLCSRSTKATPSSAAPDTAAHSDQECGYCPRSGPRSPGRGSAD